MTTYEEHCMSPLVLPHIGLVGKMGSGKTKLATFLEQALDYNVLSFADRVRSTAETIYGRPMNNDRPVLQGIGTALRQWNRDVWVDAWRLEYGELHRRCVNGTRLVPFRVVVDDCRHVNEVDALLAKGFHMIRVHADRDVRIRRLQANGKLTDEAQLDHPTETALDGFQTVHNVYNNPVDDAERQLVDILNRIRRS